MQPCTVYTCARIPSATERTNWAQQWSTRTQGENRWRNQNVKMYLKTRMTLWTGYSRRALDQLWQKSSFSLTLQAYMPQNRWSFTTIFLQEKQKSSKALRCVSCGAIIFRARSGVGRGSGWSWDSVTCKGDFYIRTIYKPRSERGYTFFLFPLLKDGRLEREARHSGILEKAQAWCTTHAVAIVLNI